MNNNLPMIKKEGIFSRIKKWINRILSREEIIIEPVQEMTQKDIEQIKENSFKEGLKVKSKDIILFLQKQLESEEIKINDLTEEQLDDMIELYQTQIEEQNRKIKIKRKELEEYGNILMKIKREA